jgi:SAM-dependent methyltransferase
MAIPGLRKLKMATKHQVHDFWNKASCGETLYLLNHDQEGYQAQAAERYRLEPMILPFAEFPSAKHKKVLEIGVGLGAEHQKFAEAQAFLYGIDLTERAVDHTRRRLNLFGLSSTLTVGDAEHLEFPDETFDIVFSWGVLHHSPNPSKAIAEVYRVLRRGGVAKIMIYHKWSMVVGMLWFRYGLLAGQPWRSLGNVCGQHLESPGTQAFSRAEAKALFRSFKNAKIFTPLSHADLLQSNAGQRHQGFSLLAAKKLWPRWLIRLIFPRAGLFMLIEANK